MVPLKWIVRSGAWLLWIVALSACGNLNNPPAPPAAAAPAATTPPLSATAEAPATSPAAPARAAERPNSTTADVNTFVAPAPVPFENSIARAGAQLLADAQTRLGNEPRTLVIDPLIDANTGAQTVSTVRMGTQLESLVKVRHAGWSVQPLTRQALSSQPLLLIGTLTPVNIERAIDTLPDAFRVWLTLIDLRTGRVVAKQLDRATVASVDPEPLKYFSDSPTWHKDKTVFGYINSCQINTKIGDAADPEYLARLPAAAVINEAIMAYNAGKLPAAYQLYKEAEPLADAGDLRVLNGLYLTNWQRGETEAAEAAFSKLVASGLASKSLPIKLLFQNGKTEFNTAGDLPQQYRLWIRLLAQQIAKTPACVRIVGHTSRVGSASVNEKLSRQRAEAVRGLLERDNRSLSTRLTATGVGSREAMVGLGKDGASDAMDRRVEFRVVDCV
jgi:outer membrane protein OmpA-like peptidoglycan-associated protein